MLRQRLLVAPGVMLRVIDRRLPVLHGVAARRNLRAAGRAILVVIFASSCVHMVRVVGQLR